MIIFYTDLIKNRKVSKKSTVNNKLTVVSDKKYTFYTRFFASLRYAQNDRLLQARRKRQVVAQPPPAFFHCQPPKRLVILSVAKNLVILTGH